ncbi:MAG: rod shape-determining protein MreC [Pseudomonadota bacterium]
MANSVSLEAGALRGVAAGTARLMFYSLLAIVLMTLDFRGAYVQRIQAAAGGLVEPVLLLIDWPVVGLRSLSSLLESQADMSRQQAELERELIELRAGLSVVDDLALENARLRDLLATTERLEYSMMTAELAAVDLDPFAHRIIVKRGRNDGVEVGMPVIDARGVVGQIEQVYQYSARVILLSDPDHALPVQILPEGERTIAYGSGALDRLRLTDLPMNTTLVSDQLVVTSGLGGQFPPGLTVGRLAQITRLPGQAFATAEIRTTAAMTRNRHVLILIEAEAALVDDALSGMADQLSIEPSPSAEDQADGSETAVDSSEAALDEPSADQEPTP